MGVSLLVMRPFLIDWLLFEMKRASIFQARLHLLQLSRSLPLDVVVVAVLDVVEVSQEY